MKRPLLFLVLLPELPAEPFGMVAAAAADVSGRSAGVTAHQLEAFGQLGRCEGLALEEIQARLHHLGLREPEGLAELIEPGLTGVVKADRDRAHRPSHERITPIIR